MKNKGVIEIIDFFEDTQLDTAKDHGTDKKSKLTKYITAGCSVLASVGIGMKTGSVLSKYKETAGIFNNYMQTVYTNIGLHKYSNLLNTTKYPFKLVKGPWGLFKRKLDLDVHNSVYPTIASFWVIYEKDPVTAVNLIIKEGGKTTPDIKYLVGPTPQSPGTMYPFGRGFRSDNLRSRLNAVTYKDPHVSFDREMSPTESEAFHREFNALDRFFGYLGIKLKSIPIIGKMTEALTERFGDTTGYAISLGIIGVLVIIVIIGVYYLTKFLYKKWKQRKAKQVTKQVR